MYLLKIKLGLLLITLWVQGTAQVIHHDLEVSLNIEGRSIEVIDSVFIPAEVATGINAFAFSLNRNLVPEVLDPSLSMIKMPTSNPDAYYYSYTVRIAEPQQEPLMIPLRYSGIIAEEITTGADEYARGFSDTRGIIGDAGVYLAGSSYWVPAFNEPLLTFDLTVSLRPDWNVVSQGKRTKNITTEEQRIVQYHAANPTEEVYLVAAAWTEYGEMAGDIRVQAFLRSPDSALAYRYIESTSDYLNMYVDLVGPYPYSKFALVENFWETGYGMPSFTLLGEKIIRFPWILYTSYPHELLHNWWGNSVYVDFKKGNWCEGLTAYMADHLLKEQAGQGADYRRTTLQKYSDYVNETNDFPVLAFQSRNNPAEEAIGYGKCLMFNHMLRKQVGDSLFVKAYQSFYKNNIYKISTFNDIQLAFEETTSADLGDFFDQWLARKGAPALELAEVNVEQDDTGYQLTFALAQTQENEPFVLDVPVAIYFEQGVELVQVHLDDRRGSYRFEFPLLPVKIEVDPGFDVFRKLDVAEVPPTLSQIFGSDNGLIILPKSSLFTEAYQALALTWQKTQEAQGKSLEVVMDDELQDIPTDRTAWIIGFENKFAALFDIRQVYGNVLSPDQTEVISSLESEGSLVYAIPHPGNPSLTIGFVGTQVEEAVPGLTRLLSHYGKYSYLGFEGERPNNILKGNFPAMDSPLFYAIPYEGRYLATEALLEPAAALIE